MAEYENGDIVLENFKTTTGFWFRVEKRGIDGEWQYGIWQDKVAPVDAVWSWGKNGALQAGYGMGFKRAVINAKVALKKLLKALKDREEERAEAEREKFCGRCGRLRAECDDFWC